MNSRPSVRDEHPVTDSRDGAQRYDPNTALLVSVGDAADDEVGYGAEGVAGDRKDLDDLAGVARVDSFDDGWEEDGVACMCKLLSVTFSL